jgi:hypothetical protein
VILFILLNSTSEEKINIHKKTAGSQNLSSLFARTAIPEKFTASKIMMSHFISRERIFIMEETKILFSRNCFT